MVRHKVLPGIKRIFYFDLVFSIVLILLGITALLDLLFKYTNDLNFARFGISSNFLLFFGIISLAIGIISLYLDRYLLCCKPWSITYRTLFSWALIIFFLSLIIAKGLDLLIVIFLVYNLIVCVYLLNKKVRRTFF